SITDSSFTWTRKAEQIRQEAALDGLYVVRTSVPAQDLPAEAAAAGSAELTIYKDGAQIGTRPVPVGADQDVTIEIDHGGST
ncbi:hypothetical protein SB781_38560, partial [Paraburkholderia sp. SIMBA_061]